MDLAELLEFLRGEDPIAAQALERSAGFEASEWVLVYRWNVEDAVGDSEHAVFIRGEEVHDARHHAGHDHQPGNGKPGFVSYGDGEGRWDTRWELVGEGDTVPLVHVRNYNGPFPGTVELAEDFRLCFDLYEDAAKREFVTVDEVGDRVVAARWIGDDLFVAKRFLRRYQAARQLHLCLQFCVDRHGGDEIKHLDPINVDIDEDTWRVAYHGANGHNFQRGRYFTRLVGKRILAPPPIEQSDIAPYDAPRNYESFIIGNDEEGQPVTHTCDPDQLANYFGKNPDAPHYLTPVYFKADVLGKYYGDPDRYAVEDGYLRAIHSFGLRMDNGRADQVAVFLGDLGTDIPFREQQYWRAFNVASAEGLSEVAFRRSFLGQWVDSDRAEHRLSAAHAAVNEAWLERFGWPLYDPLHEHDAHLMSSLHVPTNPGLSQFGDQITRLATFAVGYLNEAGIVAASNGTSQSGGINKLELLLGEQGLPTDVCGVLRRIQGARSRVATHRKGSDFDLDALLAGEPDLPTLFTSLMTELVGRFDELVVALRGLAPLEDEARSASEDPVVRDE